MSVSERAAPSPSPPTTLRVIGLMSGTSVDSIDAALCLVTRVSADEYRVQLEHAAACAWDERTREDIFRAMTERASLSAQFFCELNFAIGEGFARAARRVMDAAGVAPDGGAVDLIACHGQTLWHNVADGGAVTSTLQLGCGAVVAANSGITTVCDFRVADVARGGQGAPLASTFDMMCLRPAASAGFAWRALQNIGGIGNVTFVPSLAMSADQASPIAFDTGPGGALLDATVTTITNGAERFDIDGRRAQRGCVNVELLKRMQSIPYFDQPPPRTTGRELFSHELAERYRALAREHGASDSDLLRTLTELTAWSIVDAYRRFAPGPVCEIALSGGGARNPFLVSRIAALATESLPGAPRVFSVSELGVDGDQKEAMLMALLGAMCAFGDSGSIPSCTGARSAAVLGAVFPGRNYRSVLLRA